jgi:hypothetical protein
VFRLITKNTATILTKQRSIKDFIFYQRFYQHFIDSLQVTPSSPSATTPLSTTIRYDCAPFLVQRGAFTDYCIDRFCRATLCDCEGW